jgi:hypothetical protein
MGISHVKKKDQQFADYGAVISFLMHFSLLIRCMSRPMEAVVCGPSRRGHQFSSYEHLAVSDLLFYYAFKQAKASKG